MIKRIGFILAFFFAWLPVFILQKPAFMLYNQSIAKGCTLSDYLNVIYHGLKLDLTVAGYLSYIPLLLVIVGVWIRGTWIRKTLRVYVIATALIVAAIFAADIALYPYWGFRIDSTLFFYLKSPADSMASVPIGKAIVQTIVFLLYAALIILWFFKCIIPIIPTKMCREKIASTAAAILLGGLMFIPVRGGITTSTANVGMVYFSDNQFLNHSAINPCFNLLASFSKENDFADQFNFFPEEKRAAIFNPLFIKTDSCQNDALLNTKRPNILIIVMESFTANVIAPLGGERDVTPRMNRLCDEGILFTNLYANSFRTDRGLVSVLNGYLAQPTTSIMKYPSKSQTLPSLAGTLDSIGYTSDMLYGGDINFTNMRSYFFSSGYSKITSDEDFPLSSRLNKWGANDNITFHHLLQEIKTRESSRKWLSTFLTLSSHEPFEVPFHRLKHPYLNSVAFTDSCLGDFIDSLRVLPQWKDLLVIMVADHGYRYPDHLKDYEPKKYHIPMLWIGGAVNGSRKIDTFANQTDLAATLLHQMDLPTGKFRFSKDIMNPCVPHFVFYTFPDCFGYIDHTGVSVYDNESDKVIYEEAPKGASLRIDKGKAILQTLYDDLGSR